MKQDYQTVCDVTLGKKKDYLLKICQDDALLHLLEDCMTYHQLLQILRQDVFYKKLFIYALKALYQVSDYEQLEYHLIMMNALFDNESYQEIKHELLFKICKKSISVHEHCIIRHLIDFKNIDFSKFINKLHVYYDVEAIECAKICLLEDQYHLAYTYLKSLNDCDDEVVLDLLCSYSVYDYVSLMRHYAKKKRGYQLAVSH